MAQHAGRGAVGEGKIALVGELAAEHPDRFYYPPIAELGYVGTAIGAAIAGLRPIVDLATASFMFQAFAQITNEMANIHYMSNGQTKVPMVFHFNHGIRGGGAAQHSHSPQAMLWNTPGLEIMLPSTPYDVKGLLKTAASTDNPTAWGDHVKLFMVEGEVPEEDYAIPFGVADIKRKGSDVTIVATSLMVQRSLAAAEKLAAEGIDVEVIDPRTLVPLDKETILKSARKTEHVVIVQEAIRRGGVASDIASMIQEEAFDYLDSAIEICAGKNTSIPFNLALESACVPQEQDIIAAVKRCLKV